MNDEKKSSQFDFIEKSKKKTWKTPVDCTKIICFTLKVETNKTNTLCYK